MAEKIDIESLVGQNVNGFLLLKELGRGNNGIVFLARQQSLDREVALKVLLPEWGASEEYLTNFFREAKLVAKLDHPNIVQALETGNTPSGIHYFVMELVKGRSVEQIRTANPERLSLKFILQTAVQLSDALGYAWRTRELIHGDIKPGNLLIREGDSMLKLVDLGVARIGAVDLGDDEIMATPMYAAPELISASGKLTFKADIYSFGIMLYELISGEAPFGGSMNQLLEAHLSQIPTPLIEANPDIDRELADFIDRMIAKKPEDRPASWDEVHEFFSGVVKRLFAAPKISEQTSNASNEMRRFFDERQNRQEPQWDKRFKLVAIVLLIVALVALLGLCLAW